MTPTPWERLESGLQHCRKHDTTFSAIETCEACSTAPAVYDLGDSDSTAPVVPPDGCSTAEDHEREFCAMATYCEELAKGLSLDAESKNGSTIVKLIDSAIKARRAASALAKSREDDVFVERLERKRAAMSKRGPH